MKRWETMTNADIKALLGEPYYEIEDGLIYCCESVAAMRRFTKPSINLTVTSPPYNIGKEYERTLSVEAYVEWSIEWIHEVFRLTSENGALWLNVGYLEKPGAAKALPIPYLLWNQVPFYLIQEVVWNYGAGVAGRKFFSPRNEKLLWYVKDKDNYTFNLDDVRDPNVKYPNQKKNGKLKCNPNGKNPTDVWQIPKVTSGTNRSSVERTSHPAQFPVALIKRVVRASSNVGELIFDPFLGSGTTAVVALQNQRRFLGFELEKSYCDIAIARIEQELELRHQTMLFDG